MAIALTESAEPPAQVPAPDLPPEISGHSPWALAGRRLWRNRIAISALVLFLLIIAVCLAAPLYAHDIAKVNPFYWATNGMRDLFAGNLAATSVWVSFVVVVALTVLSVNWSLRLFSSDVR